jgi:mannosylglycerate hydrolase
VSTVVRLIQGADRVEFRTTIDNAARDHRLRVGFPAGPAGGQVRAETAFALARRPPGPPPTRAGWIEPPDATQHTLGAVAYGAIALLTKGLPEYEAREEGTQGELWLTLLRCVGVISQPEGALSTRPHTAGPQVLTPEGQCPGRLEVEYALLPDGGALDDLALLRASQDYRHGFLMTQEPVRFPAPLSLRGEVVFSCLKGAENGDGLILRCFNPSPHLTQAAVSGPVSVWRTRLDETGQEPVPGGVFTAGAGEVVTLRLRPDRAGATSPGLWAVWDPVGWIASPTGA